MKKSEALKALADLTVFVNAIPDDQKKLPKLTLCVNEKGEKSGASDAAEIRGEDIASYKSEYYYLDENGDEHFVCLGQDEHPARTGNSDFGRVEWLDENRFGPSDVYSPEENTLKIMAIPAKGKLIFAQIHRGNKAGKSMTPAAKVLADANGTIRALVKQTSGASDTQITFAHKWKVGEWFTEHRVYKDGKLFLTIAGETKEIACDLTEADATFGKNGNYNNSAVGRTHVVFKKKVK